MKTRFIIIRWALFTIILGMTAAMNAQHGNDPQNPNKPPRGPDPQVESPVPPVQPVAPVHRDQVRPPRLNIPDLTPDQDAKIRKTDLKHLAAMTPLRNQKREKSARLTSVLSTFPVNIADAENLADEIGHIDAKILKQQIRHDQEIRNLLTPDQQVIFDARPKPFLSGWKGMGPEN